MDTTVRITTRSGSTTPWLEVDYRGLRPPLALFADLEMIGWTPPAIQPPPASAIDWSTPNDATGERFTVHDYPVVAAVVSPPKGSGRDGAWNEAERAAFTTVLTGVLTRHGVAPDDAAPAAPVAEAAPAAPPPAQAAVAKARRRLSRGSRTADSPAAAPAAPARLGPVLPLSRESEDGTVLEATVAPARREALEIAVAALGFPSEVRVVEARSTQSYRGTSYESVGPAIQAVVLVPPGEEPRATAVLADLGLIEPERVLDAPPAAPAATDTVAGTAEVDDQQLAPVTAIGGAREPGVDPTLARIDVVFDPRRRSRVQELVGQMGLEVLSVETVTRMETNSYRGTSYESSVPAVHLRLAIEAAHAPRISTMLGQAAGVDAGDSDQLSITMPDAPGPGSEEVTDAEGSARPFRVIRAV